MNNIMNKKKAERYNIIIKTLKNYRYTKKRIEILLKLKEELCEYKSRGIKQVFTNNINITACNYGDNVGDDVVKIDVMMNRILTELSMKSSEVSIIDKAMSVLEDDEKDIIEMKFIDKVSTKKIESALGYERTQLNRKKNIALESIYKMIYG